MSDGVTAITTSPTAVDPGRAAKAVPATGKAGAQATTGAQEGDSLTLSPQAQEEVAKLRARDADVRAHENAHVAAGGSLITSAINFTYETGPDGKQYAVGGDVGIDTSPVQGDPQATVAKAQQIIAAALAPADPSGQDVSVAAAAAQMEVQAAAQVAAQGGQGTGKSEGQTTGQAQATGGQAVSAQTASGPAASGQTAIGPAASDQTANGPAASGQAANGPTTGGQAIGAATGPTSATTPRAPANPATPLPGYSAYRPNSQATKPGSLFNASA